MDRADRGFVLKLLTVSVLTIAGVKLLTRGSSPQPAVEARLGELRALAAQSGVEVTLLAALAVAEGYQPAPRSDHALAGALAAQHDQDERALTALVADPVQARMTVDLWHRNQRRWRRLLLEATRPR